MKRWVVNWRDFRKPPVRSHCNQGFPFHLSVVPLSRHDPAEILPFLDTRLARVQFTPPVYRISTHVFVSVFQPDARMTASATVTDGLRCTLQPPAEALRWSGQFTTWPRRSLMSRYVPSISCCGMLACFLRGETSCCSPLVFVWAHMVRIACLCDRRSGYCF